MTLTVRPARPEDVVAIQAIYSHYCLNGHATFEEEPPTVAQMSARMDAVAARGMPWVVAEIEATVRGYAYASTFRDRAAYRFTAEDTVYVAPGYQGQGIGRAALNVVIDACKAKGLRELLAVIGGADNAGSVALHRSFGFSHAGLLRNAGFKEGRWVDVVLMQLSLGGSSKT